MELLKQLAGLRIIPVIAVDRAEDIVPLGRALMAGGMAVAEITFRTEAAAEAIRLLRAAEPDMLIGAGTVLNGEQVERARVAGAAFAVSPGLNPSTVRAAQALGMPMLPGVNNPSDIEQALELGITAVKFFPAEASGGIPMLKALAGPYPQMRFMPTGGIGLHNIADYLALDNVIACGGSWMVDKTLLQRGDWSEVGRRAQEAMAFVAKL